MVVVVQQQQQHTFDFEQWLTLLQDESNTTSNNNNDIPKYNELYHYILQWENDASNTYTTNNNNTISKMNKLYSVKDWIEYMDQIDDMIDDLRRNTTSTTTTNSSSSSSNNNNKGINYKMSEHQQQQQQRDHQILLLQYMIQARDWVGRRSISYLPRSYKLWKYVWEFLLLQHNQIYIISSQQQEHSNSTSTDRQQQQQHQQLLELFQSTKNVIQCMERAIITLSSYPKIWIIYIQFLIQYPIPVTQVLVSLQTKYKTSTTTITTTTTINNTNNTNQSYNYYTFVRRTMNRALQSLPITQHSKVWTTCGIIDLFFTTTTTNTISAKTTLATTTKVSDKNNDTLAATVTSTTTSHSYYWPYDTMNRILCRYLQVASGTVVDYNKLLLDYATWCDTYHHKYNNAAVAYMTYLNQHSSSNNSLGNVIDTTATTNSIQHDGNTTSSSATTNLLLSSTVNTGSGVVVVDTQQYNIVYQSLMELIAQHSEDVIDVPWEIIIQTSIQTEIHKQQKLHDRSRSKNNNNGKDNTIDPLLNINSSSNNSTSMLGLLYTWLASAYIQRGYFDMAMSTYEDGLLHVYTVRDFSILYSAYLSLLEGILNAYYDNANDDNDNNDDDDDDDENATTVINNNDWDLLLDMTDGGTTNKNNNTSGILNDMEMAMARAEHLTARRPLLLNAVKIRQNPNDCSCYLERSELFIQSNQIRSAITILEEGIQSITNGGSSNSIRESTGGTKNISSSNTIITISHLIKRLIQIYDEVLNDIASARDVFHRVCRQRSTGLGIIKSDELADCWSTWIEFEIKHEEYDEALSLSRQSVSGDTSRNKRSNVGNTRSVVVSKSLRLWDLLLDLEENLGTVQTTKDAYNRALDIKVATVHHVLNFASFLTGRNYFEEALSAYERGIELFAFPHAGAKLLWKAYILAFLHRYKGTKIERTRNLFSRCLEHCPAEECAQFYIMNGEFEEEYGLTKRALLCYKTMCEKVPVDDIYTSYHLFIAKTTKHLGVPATRDIYQDAIEKLAKNHPNSVVKMCSDFAQMEVGLDQIDRARAIFIYGSQSADPRRVPEYWKDWNDFEIANGNEDSFREMLRIKRSVEAAFSTLNYNAVGMKDKVSNFTNEEAMNMIAASEDESHYNSTGTPVSGFVPSSSNKRPTTTLVDVEERVAKLRKVAGEQLSRPVLESRSHEINDDDEIDLDELDAEIMEAANSQ